MKKGITTICEKELLGKTKLELRTWVSDVIQPGTRMYQLALNERGLTIQFPTDYENFTKTQIRDMYNWIRCKEDFDYIRKKDLEGVKW